MARSEGVVGIYAAHGRLALAMFKGKDLKTAWVDIPDNIYKSGEIVSKNLFAEFIKDKLKYNSFRSKKVALVIGSDKVLIRNLKVPRMNEEQLYFNLPYEFKDFIKGELKDHVFDYAYRPPLPDSNENEEEGINILGVAMQAEFYHDISDVFQMAGLKMVKAVPEVCVIESILQQYPTDEERNKERCFLDIGNKTVRMMVFKDGRYKLAHIIDIGEVHVIQAIADDKNVDMELARTYLRTNYEDCGRSEAAMNAYRDISVEILKGFNFYEMSDMSSRLKDVVLYGSGAMIDPLVELLKERISMDVLTLSETFPEYNKNGDLNIVADSVAILFEA